MLTTTEIQEIIDEIIADKRIETVLLTGSYVYGKPREDSDLDIRCITNDGSDWAERSRMRFNTRVEVFFNPEEKVRDYFEQCRINGNADCIHFWANGKLVYDLNGAGLKLQEEAKQLLEKGPNKGIWENSKKYIS